MANNNEHAYCPYCNPNGQHREKLNKLNANKKRIKVEETGEYINLIFITYNCCGKIIHVKECLDEDKAIS